MPARTAPGVPPATAAGGTDVPAGPISLSSATIEELDELPVFGPITAQKIVRVPRRARAVRVGRRPRLRSRDRADADRAAARSRHAVTTALRRAQPVVRRALELHWPALLVGSACAGLALSIWISVPLSVAAAFTVAALGAVLRLAGPARVAALAVAVVVLGLAWGTLRMDALRQSVLAGEIGEVGVAELVTVAPARSSPWSTRVIATTRSFRHAQVHERVLLVLPVGRSPPPRGSILEASVRIAEPGRRKTVSTSGRGSRGRASMSCSKRRAGTSSGVVAGSPAPETGSARRSRARWAAERRVCAAGSCSASSSARTRACPPTSRTTSAPPVSTTSLLSRGRTSRSSRAGSTRSAGCCVSPGSLASSRSWR